MRHNKELKRILSELFNYDEKNGGYNKVPMLLNLISAAQAYRRLQVIGCNETLTDLQARREAKLECDMIHYATEVGYDVKFSGDPRGFVVTLTADYDETFEDVGDGFRVRTSHKTRDVVGIA